MTRYESCPTWCTDHDEVPADNRTQMVAIIEHRCTLVRWPGRMRAELSWSEACAPATDPDYFEDAPIIALWDTDARRGGGSMIEITLDRAGLDYIASVARLAEQAWAAEQVTSGSTCYQPEEQQP